MHSENDFVQQFCMNFNSKSHDDIVNIASLKVSSCKKNVTECGGHCWVNSAFSKCVRIFRPWETVYVSCFVGSSCYLLLPCFVI